VGSYTDLSLGEHLNVDCLSMTLPPEAWRERDADACLGLYRLRRMIISRAHGPLADGKPHNNRESTWIHYEFDICSRCSSDRRSIGQQDDITHLVLLSFHRAS
jgi:hypothetical protein